MADLAEVAVYLARRGWAVYPQAPHSNIPTRNCPPCKNGECPGVDCPCTGAVDPCHALHAASADVDLTAARARRVMPPSAIGLRIDQRPTRELVDSTPDAAPLPAVSIVGVDFERHAAARRTRRDG